MLAKMGQDFQFEPTKIPYLPDPKTYLPDFFLPENNFYIEVKGRLLQSDRVKHILVKKQNPDVEIKFFFSNANNG